MNNIIVPKVYVNCLTYNHVKYIKKALDGFCMQQTDFPFVCGVIDDASTDGEFEIIQKYLEEHFILGDSGKFLQEETDDYIRIFAQHKKNMNCFFVVIYLKYNHYSKKKSKLPYVSEWRDKAKYIAICEGDDYWIDSLKLKKQVDFMECHPDHSLCFCANKRLYADGTKKDFLQYPKNVEQCSMKDIILGGGGFMATNSMFYRLDKYVPYTTWAKNCPIGDLPTMLTLAHNGKVGYLSDIMCVYRVSTEGSWTQRLHNNIQKRREVFYSIIKMWREFDIWTKNKYHNYIRLKILINSYDYIKMEIRNVFNFL